MMRDDKIDFFLLLFYSLLPGISKVLNSQLFMLLYVPIILYFLFKEKIQLYKIDISFILFFSFVFLYSLLICIDYKTSKIGIFLGLGLDYVPMLGFLLFRKKNLEIVFKSVIYIVFIHSIIGIYLYPPFGIADISNPTIRSLTKGVAFGRMASVSGSLGFGNLILVGFVCAFYYNKLFACLFIFPLIFSAQRSAWIGAFLTLLLHFFFLLKKGRIMKVYRIIGVLILLLIIIIFIIQKYVNFDFSFIYTRFTHIFDGASEGGNLRIKLWQNGIDNFLQNPLGTGIGQVGQVGSRYIKAGEYNVCPDGDYFRMLSEYGINFIFFFFVVIFLFLLLPFISCNDRKSQCLYTITFVTAFQLIGSNVTEFYFDNFLFWIFLGLNFYNSKFLLKEVAVI